MTKLEVRNKDNQPTNARISPTHHNLGEDVIQGIGRVLKETDIWF